MTAAGSIPKRYVVLGLVDDINSWRRERGLSRDQVIAVPTRGTTALRGLTLAGYQVVMLPSWANASLAVRAAVERDLVMARATYRSEWAP